MLVFALGIVAESPQPAVGGEDLERKARPRVADNYFLKGNANTTSRERPNYLTKKLPHYTYVSGWSVVLTINSTGIYYPNVHIFLHHVSFVSSVPTAFYVIPFVY